MYLQVGASPWKQSISKKRASRFVILSESEESLPGQRFFALAQNDRLESALADSQDVFFEMDCPLRVPNGRQGKEKMCRWIWVGASLAGALR